jgi:hypothetical protein
MAFPSVGVATVEEETFARMGAALGCVLYVKVEVYARTVFRKGCVESATHALTASSNGTVGYVQVEVQQFAPCVL